MALPERLAPVKIETPHYMVRKRPDFGPTQVKSAEERIVGKILLFHMAKRELELGQKITDGKMYEDPLIIKILSVNLERADRVFGWLTDPELDDNGDSLAIEFTKFKRNGQSIFSSSREFQHLSLVRAGLAPDSKGNWHGLNWIQDPNKKA